MVQRVHSLCGVGGSAGHRRRCQLSSHRCRRRGVSGSATHCVPGGVLPGGGRGLLRTRSHSDVGLDMVGGPFGDRPAAWGLNEPHE